MHNAFLIALIVSVPAGLLSCFVVVKGWALMGDAISHAVLPGIVLAHVLGLPLIVGAFAAAMLCAVGTGYVSARSRLKRDTVMGVVFSAMFAAGIVLYVAMDTAAHLDHILFGNMLGLTKAALWHSAAIAAPVSALLLVKWKDLMVQSFDPMQAQAMALPTAALHYGMLAAVSLVVVATLAATGLILAIGLLVAPGAIAFLLTRRMRSMLGVAVGVCLVAMLGGVYASFFLDSAPAPTIVLILSLFFAAALAGRGALSWQRQKTPFKAQDRWR